MNELYWQNMLNVLIVLLPAAFLCLAPLREYMRAPLWSTMSIAVLSCFAYSLLALFVSIDYLNVGVLAFLIAAAWYCCSQIKLATPRVLFILLVVTSVILLIASMSNDVVAIIAGNIPKDDLQLMAEAVAVPPSENLCLFIFFAIGTPSVYVLLRRYIVPVVVDDAINGWGHICILPTAYCLLAFRAALPVRIYPSQRLPFMAVLTALALYSYTVMLQMLKHNADATRKAEHAQNVENLLQVQGEAYEMLIRQLATSRQVRHDQRHQYAVLQGLAAQDNTANLIAYLNELSGSLPEMTYKPYCQNPAVNAVVNYYASHAESVGVRTDILLDIPEHLGQISATDLCVMVGNLLENALEACMRMEQSDSWIRARAGLHGTASHHFVLVVDNSFNGILQTDGINGGYRSLKRQDRKGIGLQSVQDVCMKYDGYCTFEAKDNVFQSSVTLKTDLKID